MPTKLYCWDFHKCAKTECPAYYNKTGDCWLISGTLCHDEHVSFISKLKLCLDCKVLKQNITASSFKKILLMLSYSLEKYENTVRKSTNYSKNKASRDEYYFDILEDIIEFIPDPTFAIDNNKKVIAWNMAIEKITGVKKAEIIGKGDYSYAVPFYGYKRPILIDLINAPDKDLEKVYSNIKRESNSISGEVLLPFFKKGKDTYIWATAALIYSRDGGVLGAIEVIRDITELKEGERMVIDINNQLRGWANDLEKTTKDLSTLNSLTKLMQACTNINDAYEIISYSIMELLPAFSGCILMRSNITNQLDIVSRWGGCLIKEKSFAPASCWAFKSNRIHISNTTKKRERCNLLSKDFSGGYICIPLIAQGEAIGLLHLQAGKESLPSFELETTDSRQQFHILLGENISLTLHSIRLRENLSYQAIRDPLTNLFNRRYMEETLKRELQRARRKKSTVGLIMFDIDHFKRFNDTFGHEAGDTMLREIASFVKSNIRAEDILSRYGGEEFLITMPDSSLQTTKERAEKLRQDVKNLDVINKGQHLGAVSMSFGVAIFPNDAQDWEALIKAADDALYMAKREGRDKVVAAG